MQQVVQNIRNGKLSVMQVPDPITKAGHVLIANAFSVISAGTEKMVMDMARKSLLGKARERPDQVRWVLEKWRNEKFFNTLTQIKFGLSVPLSSQHGYQRECRGERRENGQHFSLKV